MYIEGALMLMLVSVLVPVPVVVMHYITMFYSLYKQSCDF